MLPREQLAMKTRAGLSIVAVVALAGCSEFRREVESQSHSRPRPQVSQSHSQPRPHVQRVTVNYKGPDGFYLAVGKANEWCDKRFGHSDVHLVKDDRAAGRAIFACEPL